MHRRKENVVQWIGDIGQNQAGEGEERMEKISGIDSDRIQVVGYSHPRGHTRTGQEERNGSVRSDVRRLESSQDSHK